jgi:aldehyde:ferredoxin oxidoreductase
MHGFYGKILIIDLNDHSFKTESVDETIYEQYLGGKGLASYLLYKLNPPGIDHRLFHRRIRF